MAKGADETEGEGEGKKAGKGGVGLGALIGAVVLAIGASAGISFFVMNKAVSDIKSAAGTADGEAEHAEEPEKKEPAQYVALDPAFVVNLNDPGGSRYLQVQVQVMARDEETIKAVEHNEPAIRSALLLLFGQQTSESLAGREGKEALQAKVLAEIQKVLSGETGHGKVEAVYFTSFVIQ